VSLRERVAPPCACYCSVCKRDNTDRLADIQPLLDRARAEGERVGAARALQEAADKWQWGEWANAPRCADRVQERIANAQYVTDWLRERNAALSSSDATEASR